MRNSERPSKQRLIKHLILIGLLFVNPYNTSAVPPQPVNLDTEISRLAVEYKQSEALAKAIIACEGKHYKKLGNNNNYDNGVVWSTDIGPWQINDHYHEKEALKKGFDIYNEKDNLEYGFHLLSTQGTAPWKASKKCWDTL